MENIVPRSPSYGVYFRNIFVVPEAVQIVAISAKHKTILTAKLLQRGYLDIIKFIKHFLNYTTDTQTWLLNTILV